MRLTLPQYYYDGSFKPFDDLLTNGLPREKYQADIPLVSAGEFMDQTYYVHQGIIKLYIISNNGKEKTQWFIGPGGLFPLYSPLERRYKGERDELLVKTQIPTTLTRISQSRIQQLIQDNPDFAKVMLRQYADFTAILLYDIINLASASSMTKVCNYIYQYVKVLQPNGIVLSQEEIANNIGIPLLTLSRILKKLCAQRIINTGWKKIQVLNWQALLDYCSPELIDN